MTPRTNVHENLMPHEAWAEIPLVSYMGQYDAQKIKFCQERNQDFKLYTKEVVCMEVALMLICLIAVVVTFLLQHVN